MNLLTIATYFFEAIAALSAVGIIFVRNVFYGALLLISCLLSLAAIFVLANAEFLAVTQILVYAGGVLVLIIFGIMLTARISGKPMAVQNIFVFSGILAGSTVFGIIAYVISSVEFKPGAESVSSEQVPAIGIHLMTDYLLPFEIAGVLLLVALIAAIVLSSSKSKSI